ncbi:energy-coupling factor transporter transmembrane protein EcfT [Candidatus Thorarchaeota archaeon]|nr:MAG: energy-coupling factor transporter transmembrane protein EcfT [Candidatus Thorarchaeota archaeon]
MASRIGFMDIKSPVHQLHPLTKLWILLALNTSVILYPDWAFGMVIFLVVLLTFRLARVSLAHLIRKLRFILVFSVLLFVVQVLVTTNGNIFIYLIPRIGPFGPAFPVTDYGITRGASIVLRFLVIVLSSMLFVATTDPTLLSYTLTDIGVPYRYAFGLVVALSFLPLFDQENETVRMAQHSRGIYPEVGGIRKTLRTIRYTFFPLLVSALTKAEFLSLSMDGRGFGYRETRTYLRKPVWKLRDTTVSLLMLLLLVVVILTILGLLPQTWSV